MTTIYEQVLAAWNSHDGTKLAELMTEDGTYEDVPTGRAMDQKAIVDFVAETHTLSSDFSIRYVSTQGSGDRYAAEWEMSGTNDGPIVPLGLAASGKPWLIRGCSVGQLQDGRIKLHRDYWDLAGFLGQLH